MSCSGDSDPPVCTQTAGAAAPVPGYRGPPCSISASLLSAVGASPTTGPSSFRKLVAFLGKLSGSLPSTATAISQSEWDGRKHCVP